MTTPVQPEEAFGGRVRVVCPNCAAMATVEPFGDEVRLMCTACTLTRTLQRWSAGRKLYFRDAVDLVRREELALWFSADWRGHELWALDETHLAYVRRFVASTNRSAEFPSPPGARQLSDKFPSWLTDGRSREHLLARLARIQRECS